MGSPVAVKPKKESVTTITKPTLKSKKFEDQVTVVRIFNPDEKRMVSALRYILSLPVLPACEETG